MPTHAWQQNKRLATSGIGYVEFSGVTADGEQVIIGTRTYEFDTDAMVTALAVAVDISGGNSAAQSTAALVAAINTDASRTVDALNAGGDVCVLVHRTQGNASNIALAEGAAAAALANGTVSGALLTGGNDEGLASVQTGFYTFTAADVTTLGRSLGTSQIVVGMFPSTTEPRLISAVLRSSAGVIKNLTDLAFVIVQVNTNQWALVVADAVAGATIVSGDLLGFYLVRSTV